MGESKLIVLLSFYIMFYLTRFNPLRLYSGKRCIARPQRSARAGGEAHAFV